MKFIRSAAPAATLLGCLAAATPASAQFSSPSAPPPARDEAGAPSKRTTLLIFPFAPFVAHAGAQVRTLFGGLIAAETAILPNGGRPYALGGWYWTNGPGDLLELHGKYYFSGSLGTQLGLLSTTKGGGAAYDAFLIYNLTPRLTAKYTWNIQAAAGIYVDPTNGRTTTGFTGFVQGSTPLSPSYNVNISYWYIDNRGKFNRTALGVSYNF